MDSSLPVYEWDAATIWDASPSVSREVHQAKLQEYLSVTGDRNPVLTDPGLAARYGLEGCIPIGMTVVVVPGQRGSVMLHGGYSHPVRPTPFARWQLNYLSPVRIGDVMMTESMLVDKFERRGRHYLVWKVIGRNQAGERSVEYRSTNLWDLGRPEDRLR